MKITPRIIPEVPKNGIWFLGTRDDGKKYSIVDFGALMETSPISDELRNSGLFMGWEAMELNENEELSSEPIRASTLDGLINKLENTK